MTTIAVTHAPETGLVDSRQVVTAHTKTPTGTYVTSRWAAIRAACAAGDKALLNTLVAAIYHDGFADLGDQFIRDLFAAGLATFETPTPTPTRSRP